MMNPVTPPPGDDPLFGNKVSGLLDCALGSVAPGASASSWEPLDPEHVARLLPQYRVTRMLGRGGMGAVYQGIQVALERLVAIKILPAELSANADFTSRFQREAQMLGSLNHPGIVTVHDFGQTGEGHLYFVMEFVDGTDLAHVLHAQRLDPDQALDLTVQICEALQHAHSKGVLHRDIKPANVLLTRDGRAKLADFGLARPTNPQGSEVTSASLIMGTPDYMAPEQWLGHADHRADIYALGVMLYEMLTGTRPQGVFDPPSAKARVDTRLDEVVVKAMRQEPDRRYQEVSELRQDVERIRTTHPPVPGQTPRTAKQRSGFEKTAWALLAVVMLGLACAFWMLAARDGGKSPAPLASPAATKQPDGVHADEPPKAAAAPLPAPSSSGPASATPVPDPPKVQAPVPAPSPTPQQPVPANVSVNALPPSAPPASPAPVAAPPAIEFFKEQAPELMDWILAPLEDPVPDRLRPDLTEMREDLVDEGRSRPVSSMDAYRSAYYLCEGLLAALAEREKARVAAGYRAAQAVANETGVNQTLESRRNYLMSWPQFHREKSQREALRRQSGSRVATSVEAQKVAWNTQVERLRSGLDKLDRQFRAAMRG